MYSISLHAAQQAKAKGWTLEEVYAAANRPTVTYPNGRYEGQMRHIRNGIVAVCDPRQHKVVTVYANVERTPLRPDQR